jgi:hypothetical protein
MAKNYNTPLDDHICWAMNDPAFVDFSLDFILWIVSCAHKLKNYEKNHTYSFNLTPLIYKISG